MRTVSLDSVPYNHRCHQFYTVAVCFDNGSEISSLSEAEPNARVHALGVQSNPPWHLRYISHPRRKEMPDEYRYKDPQASTTVYVVDGWLDIDHPEFEGRASRGAVFSLGDSGGHATHVAGLVGGRTMGVNRNAKLVGVQVLDSSGWDHGPPLLQDWNGLLSKRPCPMPSSISVLVVGTVMLSIRSLKIWFRKAGRLSLLQGIRHAMPARPAPPAPWEVSPLRQPTKKIVWPPSPTMESVYIS